MLRVLVNLCKINKALNVNTSYDLEPKVNVKGQIMYFLVKASSPKLLDVAT